MTQVQDAHRSADPVKQVKAALPRRDTEGDLARLRARSHCEVKNPSDTIEYAPLRSVLTPIILHCALCYLQSSMAEISYTLVGDVSTILAMQAGCSIILCPLLGFIGQWCFLGDYYPTDFRMPSKYLKMLIIPNLAFAFQLLFKQLAIQKAGVGFGEIISGFSVVIAAWLQYYILDIRLSGMAGFSSLALYIMSLVAAWFHVGWTGIGIGLVQGSCSSMRTIFTRRANNHIVIKPGHHQFFTGCTNFVIMGSIAIWRHKNLTFYDYADGRPFLPITRIFWPVSLKQFVTAFSDNMCVFYLMSLMAPLSYHLQSQVESLLSTTLDFAGVTEMLGGHHKSFFNLPTICAYFFRVSGVGLYSYSKLCDHFEGQQKLNHSENCVTPKASQDTCATEELSEYIDLSDRIGICTEGNHGVYLSVEQRREIMRVDRALVVIPSQAKPKESGASRFTSSFDFSVASVNRHRLFSIASPLLASGKSTEEDWSFARVTPTFLSGETSIPGSTDSTKLTGSRSLSKPTPTFIHRDFVMRAGDSSDAPPSAHAAV